MFNLYEKAPRGKRSNTILRTSPLPERLDEVLRSEAEIRGLSPNALASMIITRFADWDRFADRFDFMVVTRR
jgi:ribosomal protein L32E